MVPRVHRMHAAADDTEDWSECRHVFAPRGYKNRITKILCTRRWMEVDGVAKGMAKAAGRRGGRGSGKDDEKATRGSRGKGRE